MRRRGLEWANLRSANLRSANLRSANLRSAKLQITNRKSQIRQRGYMMITLMLAVALLMLGLLAVLPSAKQQITRDREEEMRHRGTAYMRAIQHFYKKFGRYPSRVEELENTNNLRFLRKRYTDPMSRDAATGKEKDFKFLHQQDIALNNGPVLGQQQPGQTGAPGVVGGQSGSGGFGGASSGFGGLGGQAAGGVQQKTQGSSTTSGSDSSSSDGSSPGSASSNSSSSDKSDAEGNSNSSGSSSSSPNGSSGSGLNGQTFGGGPILGVASTSKAKSIRVFFQKDHYNDWLFVYMPQADRGGLLTGPINPGMQTGVVGGLNPGQAPGGTPGQPGFGQSGFGQSGFGQAGPGQTLQTQTPQAPAQSPQQ